MKRAATIVALFVAGFALSEGAHQLAGDHSTTFMAGPVPTCFGETATHVLVAEIDQRDTEFYVIGPTERTGPYGSEEEARAAAIAPYQEWIDQGVSVEATLDALIMGTRGHDTLVSLVDTNSGGFVSSPGWQRTVERGGPTAGDNMCSFAPAGLKTSDLYYASKWTDKIYDATGGSDRYYAGGCQNEGEGSPGDRACDVIIDEGPVGTNHIYLDQNSFGADFVWGYFVPRGRTQTVTQGEGRLHSYLGRGPGKVKVEAGGCLARESDLTTEPCETFFAPPMNGDHVHLCPEPESPKDLSVKNTYRGVTVNNVEYMGPEPPDKRSNPCAIQVST